MEVYIYSADIYCEDCGEAICEQITREGFTPADPDDERSYDSDEYPKGPYPGGGGEADSPRHCGSGPDCVNALELSDGCKVGAWLENELTTEGIEYVRGSIQEDPDNEVCRLWAEWYADELERSA